MQSLKTGWSVHYAEQLHEDDFALHDERLHNKNIKCIVINLQDSDSESNAMGQMQVTTKVFKNWRYYKFIYHIIYSK